MKFEIEYRKNYVRMTIVFTDVDGCHCDSVRVDKIGNKPARVSWGIPGNNSLANAKLWYEAIEAAIDAAEVIDRGMRLERVWFHEWGNITIVIDETQPA